MTLVLVCKQTQFEDDALTNLLPMQIVTDCCSVVFKFPPFNYQSSRGRSGSTAAAAPPPFRPRNPALCGSHPLVTPYYCRLGDLLCFVLMCPYCIFCVNCVISVFLQYFDAVDWVFWPVKTVARITYTVLVETLNPAQSINQSINQSVAPHNAMRSAIYA